jgi:hypothetical protein
MIVFSFSAGISFIANCSLHTVLKNNKAIRSENVKLKPIEIG